MGESRVCGGVLCPCQSAQSKGPVRHEFPVESGERDLKWRSHSHIIFTAAPFTMAQLKNRLKCLPTEEWVKKM